jgi:hypothetical protein
VSAAAVFKRLAAVAAVFVTGKMRDRDRDVLHTTRLEFKPTSAAVIVIGRLVSITLVTAFVTHHTLQPSRVVHAAS